MFFSSVSSKTACSFLLISRESSRVMVPSRGTDPYTDAMIPPCRISSAWKIIRWIIIFFFFYLFKFYTTLSKNCCFNMNNDVGVNMHFKDPWGTKGMLQKDNNTWLHKQCWERTFFFESGFLVAALEDCCEIVINTLIIKFISQWFDKQSQSKDTYNDDKDDLDVCFYTIMCSDVRRCLSLSFQNFCNDLGWFYVGTVKYTKCCHIFHWVC